MLMILKALILSGALVGAGCQQKNSASLPPSASLPSCSEHADQPGCIAGVKNSLSPQTEAAASKAAASLGKAPQIGSQTLQKPSVAAGGGAQVPAELQGKPFLAMRVPYHRPIWLDLTQEVWADFNKISDKFVAGYATAIDKKEVSDYIASSFARPQVPVPLKVSIQQPLPAPWLPKFSADTTVLFSVVGFAAWSADVGTGQKTLVVADSPFFTPARGEVLLQEPKEYHSVYEHQSPLLAELVKDCYEKLNSPTMNDHAKTDECEAVLAATDITSYNATLKTANNAFTDLYQKRSVKIWRADCPEGFAALGDIATNGRMDKPYSEMDFSQGPFSSAYTAGSKRAMYCLPKKYLAPGKLGPLIYREAVNGGLELYGITPVDNNGLASEGLFVARVGGAAVHPELWVIDRQFVVMVAP